MSKQVSQVAAGYRAFNGHVFTGSEADLYNRTCADAARIESLYPGNPEHPSVDRAKSEQCRVFKIIIGA